MHTKYLNSARLAAMGVRFVDGDPAEQPGAAASEHPKPQQPGPGAHKEPAQVVGAPARPNGEDGYPLDTPITEMTADQQAAYWKHKARTHEDKWKQVVNRNLTPEQVLEMQQQLDDANRARMSDHQREVDDARKEGAVEVRAALMPQIVRTAIAAELARKAPQITDEDLQARTEYLDLTKFLTSTGEVDADKVSNYAATLAPAAPAAGGDEGGKKKFPDMGGGKRGPVTESAKARADRVARERGWVRD